MVKKRLIFSLLYHNDDFMLSRNFRLQKVGNLDWLKENYDFDAITNSIDELVVLNVERTPQKDSKAFAKNLSALVKNCFIPVAAGGGINAIADAYTILNAGVDKLIINTALYHNKPVVKELVKIFGSQCIVASIDFKIEQGKVKIFSHNGSVEENITFEQAILNAQNLGAGEIYLTAINNDGTGQGLDLAKIIEAASITNLPIIASGGIGNFKQILEAIKLKQIDAISTANLFNFMADGLTEARDYLEKNGVSLAKWDKINRVR